MLKTIKANEKLAKEKIDPSTLSDEMLLKIVFKCEDVLAEVEEELKDELKNNEAYTRANGKMESIMENEINKVLLLLT